MENKYFMCKQRICVLETNDQSTSCGWLWDLMHVLKINTSAGSWVYKQSLCETRARSLILTLRVWDSECSVLFLTESQWLKQYLMCNFLFIFWATASFYIVPLWKPYVDPSVVCRTQLLSCQNSFDSSVMMWINTGMYNI